MSHYVHHVPGRLRVRAPELRRNEERAREVSALLASMDGVLEQDINTMTGSLVVRYDRDVTAPARLLAALHADGHLHKLLDVDNRGTHAGDLSARLSKTGSNVGKAMMGVLIEKAVERSAVALIGALL